MNICKKCEKYTKSGICLYFRLRIVDIFDDCEHFVSSIPEIKSLSFDEQFKIALNRIAETRKNRKIENIQTEIKSKIDSDNDDGEKEDNGYAERISGLVVKFADPDNKQKKYIKPLWKVNPRKDIK